MTAFWKRKIKQIKSLIVCDNCEQVTPSDPTCQWCRTCQFVDHCSFPSASAAPWSNPLIVCPQLEDACSPGSGWKGSRIPARSLQQDNLRSSRHDISERKPAWGCFSSLLHIPPKKSWLPVTMRNGGRAWAYPPSSSSAVTVKRPFLEFSATECHWPSFRAEPEVIQRKQTLPTKSWCHSKLQGEKSDLHWAPAVPCQPCGPADAAWHCSSTTKLPHCALEA